LKNPSLITVAQRVGYDVLRESFFLEDVR